MVSAGMMPPHRVIIGVMAFLTVIDLFAMQAILPSLARTYAVSPAAMASAVNASTMGMAVSCLLVACFGRHLDRAKCAALSLLGLSLPTVLLAAAPDLATFAVLRVTQGLLMAAAFTLTLAHLSDGSYGSTTQALFAAYVTGNVASNLLGRIMAAALADHFGVTWAFYVFATLNAAGGLLAWFTLGASRHRQEGTTRSPAPSTATWVHLRDRRLLAAFAIGHCILFAFVGTFTYVNFTLAAPPLSLGMMALGLTYFVFLPSLLSTPLAGWFVTRLGVRCSLRISLAVSGLGLPLLLSDALMLVLCGMAMLAAGAFMAQAIAAGFVGRVARQDAASASGLYLASYFFGGVNGSFVLGHAYEAAGWYGCIAGIGVSLVIAGLLSTKLTELSVANAA